MQQSLERSPNMQQSLERSPNMQQSLERSPNMQQSLQRSPDVQYPSLYCSDAQQASIHSSDAQRNLLESKNILQMLFVLNSAAEFGRSSLCHVVENLLGEKKIENSFYLLQQLGLSDMTELNKKKILCILREKVLSASPDYALWTKAPIVADEIGNKYQMPNSTSSQISMQDSFRVPTLSPTTPTFVSGEGSSKIKFPILSRVLANKNGLSVNSNQITFTSEEQSYAQEEWADCVISSSSSPTAASSSSSPAASSSSSSPAASFSSSPAASSSAPASSSSPPTASSSSPPASYSSPAVSSSLSLPTIVCMPSAGHTTKAVKTEVDFKSTSSCMFSEKNNRKKAFKEIVIEYADMVKAEPRLTVASNCMFDKKQGRVKRLDGHLPSLVNNLVETNLSKVHPNLNILSNCMFGEKLSPEKSREVALSSNARIQLETGLSRREIDAEVSSTCVASKKQTSAETNESQTILRAFSSCIVNEKRSPEKDGKSLKRYQGSMLRTGRDETNTALNHASRLLIKDKTKRSRNENNEETCHDRSELISLHSSSQSSDILESSLNRDSDVESDRTRPNSRSLVAGTALPVEFFSPSCQKKAAKMEKTQLGYDACNYNKKISETAKDILNQFANNDDDIMRNIFDILG